MSNKTILIIDYHQSFREMLRSFIENNFKHIDIKEAITGEGGVEIATIQKPDVCLIDIRLPGIDGLETARLVKAQVPECQIVTMSMFRHSSLQDSIASEVGVFINKGEVDSQLIPLLKKIFNK